MKKTKKSATDAKTLRQVAGLVDSMIAKRLPAFDSLLKVRNQFSELVVAAKSIAARDPNVGDGLPSDFVAGLDAAILSARSFRSGYASNDASQQIEDMGTIPGIAPVNTVKAAAPVEKGKRVSVAEFTGYAASVVKSLDGMDAADQLATLRKLQAVCRKANEEDFSDVLIPTDNDPDKQKADVTEGSIVANTGTGTGGTGGTDNFSAGGTPPAAGASGGSNASTGSIVATAGTGTGGAPGSDNFSAGGAPTASAAGAASGTSNTTAVPGVGTGGTPGSDNFSAGGTPPVQKSASEAPDHLATLNKAASQEEDIDWSGDLTGARFMRGEKDPARDFGAGNDLGLVSTRRGDR